MNISRELDKVEFLLKHMPGRHNQQRHAGSHHAAGGFSEVEIERLIAKQGKRLLSDSEHEANEAAAALRSDMKALAYEKGFGDEFTHWSGDLGPYEEWKKFQPVEPWMEKPSYIPESWQSNAFPYMRLSRYYEQEPGGGDKGIIKTFNMALGGTYGDKHRAAATAIRDTSQAVFKKKFGNTATFYRTDRQQGRSGEVVRGTFGGVSVSESRGGATQAAKVTSGGDITSEITVNAEDVIFGFRVIPSPYPEREWVVGKFRYAS